MSGGQVVGDSVAYDVLRITYPAFSKQTTALLPANARALWVARPRALSIGKGGEEETDHLTCYSSTSCDSVLDANPTLSLRFVTRCVRFDAILCGVFRFSLNFASLTSCRLIISHGFLAGNGLFIDRMLFTGRRF